MIKAICFDFDGTLAEYQGDFTKLGLEVFSDLGLSNELFPKAFAEFIELDRTDGARNVVDMLEHIATKLNLAKSNLASTANLMNQKYCSEIKLLDSAKKTLDLVKHLPLAIITNGPSDMQRYAIKAVAIEDYFTTIVVSADKDVAVRKPKAKIFQIAANRLACDASEILMIGNSIDDIAGGQAAGFKTISFDERHGVGSFAKNHQELRKILKAKYLYQN
ncbi:MAG TPA: HAD family hydrolase [Trueperaceae bacterium]|nr:HAD family hydrolase [Trueperaceae bacterium]